MKKFIAIILAILMLTMSASSFARDPDDQPIGFIFVSFNDINWEEIDGFIYDGTIDPEKVPEPPVVDGYEFLGWDHDLTLEYIDILFVYALYRQYGDINNDGNVTYKDLSILRSYLAGDTEIRDKDLNFADCNRDGKVDEADAELIISIYSSPDYKLVGDTNNDGKVNTRDAVLPLKYAAYMIEYPDRPDRRYWDMNRDKKIDTADAAAILKYVVEN